MMRSLSLLLLLLAQIYSTIHAFSKLRHYRLHKLTSIRAYPIEKSQDEWRALLKDDEAFAVLRNKGTEPPYSSKLNDISQNDGILICKACKAPLFSVETKYDSKTGWPSFYAPICENSIDYKVDYDAVLPRMECLCSQCGSHLGHVFEDGPTPTFLRYCMNGISMELMEPGDESDKATKIHQQDPLEAARLSINAILPSVLINFGIATLMFLSYWTKRNLPTTTVKEVLVAVPLPFAVFFAWTAIKSLMRARK